MPIEWESGKGIVVVKTASGHPKKCKAMPAHSTRKDGKCKTYYKCNFAGVPGCVARGGT